MKKLCLALLFLLVGVMPLRAEGKKSENLKFVDATTLNLGGHTMKTEKSPYFRFDCEPYNFDVKNIIRYSRYSSGLYVTFKTTSSQVWATWENVSRQVSDNMTPIFQLGMDLYIKDKGEWVFCAVGRISTDPAKNCRTRSLIANLPEGEKEFLLYLPCWAEVTKLEIGVDKNSTIEPLTEPFRHKIVAYGSSITHGASASRPGMTYPARMSRNLGLDIVNFGFSGQCKMQPQFLEFLVKCEADAFLFDCFANPTADEIAERVDNFVTKMVEAHPGKPLIFLRSFHNEDEFYDLKRKAAFAKKIAVTHEKMAVLTKKYNDVYYLDYEYATGRDCNSTIDTSHPNDLGFDRVISYYEPKVVKILKKYGIK